MSTCCRTLISNLPLVAEISFFCVIPNIFLPELLSSFGLSVWLLVSVCSGTKRLILLAKPIRRSLVQCAFFIALLCCHKLLLSVLFPRGDGSLRLYYILCYTLVLFVLFPEGGVVVEIILFGFCVRLTREGVAKMVSMGDPGI
jgi:hypothetical protein